MIVRKRERNTNSGHGRMTPMSNTGPGDFPMTFEAVLTDYPASRPPPRFHWETSDGNLRILTPQAQRTLVAADSLPSWCESRLSVTADFGNDTLLSELVFHYGIYEEPQVHLSVSVPDTLLLVDDWMPGSQSAMAHVAVHSDIKTNGNVRVSVTTGADKVSVGNGALGGHSFSGACDYGLDFTIDGIGTSDAVGDVLLPFEFLDADGNAALTDTKRVTVVSPKRISVNGDAASDVAVLVGSGISMTVVTEPPGVSIPEVYWFDAKLRANGTYEEWREWYSTGMPLNPIMNESGIFKFKAAAHFPGPQWAEVSYVWTEDENSNWGIRKEGDTNHVGVAATQSQLDLRAAARVNLGITNYAFKAILPARNGFSSVDSDEWKCNAFVADMATSAGLSIPSLHKIPPWFPVKFYPPLANEWANGTVSIARWSYLGRTTWPEPGLVMGHPATGGPGHVGIVDFDGRGIAAGKYNVNRNYKFFLDGSSGFNRYTGD